MEPEKWWISKCSDCGEETLSPCDSGPCPYCDEEGSVTYTFDSTPRAVAAQQKVGLALWELAKCGPPEDGRGVLRPEFIAGAGVALETIMAQFGYVVTNTDV